MVREKRINIESIKTMMEPINKDERRRRRAVRRAKNRRTIKDMIIGAIIIAVVILGGRYQRGEWCIGPEIIVILPMVAVIIARRTGWRI